ncbi:WD40 repeat domain-containing protein, partial [filamentous cyanobacterium CCP5]
LPHPDAWIDQLTWHPQQNLLAYGVGSQVQIWDVEHNRLVANLEFASSSVLHLAWHPDGHLLAVSGHGGVKVWDTADWSAEPRLIAVPGASLYAGWSSHGRYLASGNLDRTLTVVEWDSPPPWLMQGFPGKVRQVAWADGTASKTPLLAAACVEGITLWRLSDPDKGWKSQVLQHHQDRVNAIAFQPDHCLLASAGADGKLCLWHQGRPRQTLQAKSGLSTLAWHPSGFYLATGSISGEVSVWKPQAAGGRGFGS